MKKTKTKKKYWFKMLIIMTVSGICGFCTSMIVNVDKIISFFTIDYSIIYTHLAYIFICIQTLFVIISCILLRRIVFLNKNNDDDLSYVKSSKLTDIASFISSLVIILGIVQMAFLNYIIDIHRVLFLIYIIITLINIIISMYITKKLLETSKDMLFVKDVNIYDDKELKYMDKHMDEGMQLLIYKSSYKSMQTTLSGLVISISVTMILTIMFEIDINYILIQFVILLSILAVYTINSWKYEHGEENKYGINSTEY